MYVFADVGEDNGGQPTNVVELYYGDPNTTSTSSRDNLYQLQIELPQGEALPDRIWSIAEDEQGELYLLVGPDRLDLFNRQPGESDGAIWKLVAPQFVLNGIAGDINQDGFVNGDGTGLATEDDVAAFVANFFVTGYTSAFDRVTHGDLNLDGRTDVLDWFILYQNHENAGSLNLADLLAGHRVPEPSTLFMAVLGVGAVLLRRRA